MMMAGYPLMLSGRRFVCVGFLAGTVFLSCTRELYLEFIPAAYLLVFLLLISAYDVIYGLIFNRLLLFMGCFALLFAAEKGTEHLASAMIGAVFGFLLFFVLRVLSHNGKGGGDVKLAFVLGLWLGLRGALLAFFLAFCLGGVTAVVLLVFRQAKAGEKIAFGPFLAFGAYVSLLYGQLLFRWYEEML